MDLSAAEDNSSKVKKTSQKSEEEKSHLKSITVSASTRAWCFYESKYLATKLNFR